MKQKIIRTPWDRRGFTLVELLVVISIIALLVSILLPALNKARLQAKYVMCASNQHQIIIGLNTYQAEWDGKLPPSSSGTASIPGHLKLVSFPPVVKTLGKYLPEVDIFFCPASPYELDVPHPRWNGQTAREAYRNFNCALAGSYNLMWNYEGFEQFGFKPASKGKHTLMTSDTLAYSKTGTTLGDIWWFNHPCSGSSKYPNQPIFCIKDTPQNIPDIQQNAGYLDGHVERTSTREWKVFGISNLFCLPREWK